MPSSSRQQNCTHCVAEADAEGGGISTYCSGPPLGYEDSPEEDARRRLGIAPSLTTSANPVGFSLIGLARSARSTRSSRRTRTLHRWQWPSHAHSQVLQLVCSALTGFCPPPWEHPWRRMKQFGPRRRTMARSLLALARVCVIVSQSVRHAQHVCIGMSAIAAPTAFGWPPPGPARPCAALAFKAQRRWIGLRRRRPHISASTLAGRPRSRAAATGRISR